MLARSNTSYLDNLKKPACASKQDGLLFASLDYFYTSLFLGICNGYKYWSLDQLHIQQVWFKLSQALSKVDGTSGGIAVMFNDSGFWFKAQVEKLQGHLSKDLIIKSHCYTIFG